MSEQTTQPKKKLSAHQKHFLKLTALVVGVIVICVGVLLIQFTIVRIKMDKATVTGDVISLSAPIPGTLDEVFVHEGDVVPAHTVVARVDQTLIRTDVAGLITNVNENIGTRFNPGQAVVTMIDPNTLRVVGQLDENKGLDQVHVGQQAVFTVDAFGSKKYEGIVDEVSSTSRESGIIFNISDKRETKTFNVYVRFDVSAYPELKNGMSARVSIVK